MSQLAPPPADSPLFSKVQSYDWFKKLPREQQLWLQGSINTGFVPGPPVSVHFYSFSSVTLYESADSTKIIASFPPVPHTVAYGNDGGAGGQSLKLHEILNGRLRVTYGNVTGWIARFDLWMSSVIVAGKDGSYIRDIFPNYGSGQSSAGFWLVSREGRIYFVVQYIRDYKGADKKLFGFQYDPEKNEIVDVILWANEGPDHQERSLSDLIGPAELDKFSQSVGLGRLGFVKSIRKEPKSGTETETMVETAPYFWHALTTDSQALLSGNYILMNPIYGRSPSWGN